MSALRVVKNEAKQARMTAMAAAATRRGDDAQAKRHVVRSAYPTPRTVWMSRGSSRLFELASQVADVDGQ